MVTATKARPKAKAATVVAKKATAAPRARAAAPRRTVDKLITVKVASLPGVAQEVVLNSSAATVEQALRGAGMHAGGDVRVNNVPVKADDKTLLREGSIVTVVGQVNGGN